MEGHPPFRGRSKRRRSAGGMMPNREKQRAKFERAKEEAQQDVLAARKRAEKKMARVRRDLEAEEARIAGKLESRRDKMQAKLARAGLGLEDKPGRGARTSSGARRIEIDGKPRRRGPRA